MKLYILLYLMFLVPAPVVGRSTTDALKPRVSTADYCGGVDNFSECKIPLSECNVNSKCFCKDKQPYCRCNNYKDMWFMGENCEQKWNILTFALVATLPGLALAAVVGVTVQFVHQLRKSAEPAKNPDGHTKQGTNDEDPNGAYSNLVFASDLPGPPMGSRMQPTQERIPMTSPLSQPYSPQPNNMRPTATLANPESQPYRPQPNSPSSDRTVVNPIQPYNYVTGMSQPVGNPYARSAPVRNPYEDRSPPPSRYDYRPSQLPSIQNSMMGGGMSGFPAAGSPAPFYSAPEYSPSRSQFPRAQMGRHM